MEDCIPRRECDQCKELYDEKIDNLDVRLKEVESSVKQLHALTVSVEKMAMSLDQMTKELAKQGQKLEAIEAEPAQRWKQASWIVLSVIITAVVTLFLSRMGVK